MRDSGPGPVRRLALCAVVVGSLFASALAVLTPSYQSNDDPVAAMFASGTALALSPDAHLHNTNLLLGSLLKRLYEAWPLFPFYGAMLVVFQLLAHVAILFAILRAGGGTRALWAYLLFFGSVGLYFLNNLQFTTTALLAAQAGLWLWLACAVGKAAPPDGTACFTPALAGAALVTVAALVRLESLYLALVLALPALVWGFSSRARRRRVRGLPLAAALALVAIAGAVGYDRRAYQRDPAWRDFRDMAPLLRELVDFDRASYGQQTAAAYAAVGWTQNDVRLLRNWYFLDAGVYGLERMRTAVAGLPPAPGGMVRPQWPQVWRALARPAFVPILLALPLALAGVWPSRDHRLVLGVTAVGGVGVLGLVLVLGHAPERVVGSVVAWPVALALLLGQATGDAPGASRASRRLAAVLALLAVAVSVQLQLKQS